MLPLDGSRQGSGYDYLTKEVATSKHDYYAGHGEAPGVWAGRGVGALGLSGEVTADDMACLYGRFVDPRSAGSDHEVVLGRKVAERTIHAGTPREKLLKPVAAFDVTFSPSKSVSALWAAASNVEVREAVVEAHEAAVAAALDYLEDNVGHARAGVKGIRRVDTDGLIIAQFRHRTARSTQPGVRIGDPQLHSHCAILNRLRCLDGTWRTLDGQAIYRHTHAAGAFYGARLERELTGRLGVEWTAPQAGQRFADARDRRDPRQRAHAMVVATRADHCHRSTAASTSSDGSNIAAQRATRSRRMKSDATLRSRNAKSSGNVELHSTWRADLSVNEINAIDSTVGRIPTDALSGGRLEAGSEALSVAALQALETQRSWWTRPHLFAEVARLTDTATREAIEIDVERILVGCVNLETDTDGGYAQLDTTKFTSPRIIAAEQYVLSEASRDANWTIEARPRRDAQRRPGRRRRGRDSRRRLRSRPSSGPLVPARQHC